jgi:hypothetical protein
MPSPNHMPVKAWSQNTWAKHIGEWIRGLVYFQNKIRYLIVQIYCNNSGTEACIRLYSA